jgi:murein DD-endopeptidase MepM/ murein hydrolase activator NlpD
VRDRRWTILVVPHDSESPRQFHLSERAAHFMAGALGVAGLMVLAAGVMLFSPWATPGARLMARDNLRLAREVAILDSAILTLGDSVASLAEREEQFRQLAGVELVELPGTVATAETPAPAKIGLASMERRARPFEQFFGDRATRPDVDALLKSANELSSAFAVVYDSMESKREKLRNTPSLMPTRGWLSGAFSSSRLHPILHEMRPHAGIDVSAPAGTAIVAPAGGVVVRVAREAGYGNILEIDHGNGILTRYAHCARIVARRGQRVDRGQLIATVGNTGLSVGPHLHYEIHVDGKPVDPLTYVIPE